MDRLKEKKFDYVVQVGDLLDQYDFTRFTKKRIQNADKELKSGRYFAETFWDKVRTLQPNAKLIQLLGNHDIRMLKRCEEKLPEAQELVKASLLELYRFDHVKTLEDPRDEFIVKNIMFHHGYKSKLGDHTRYTFYNTVHGHTHRGGVAYVPIRGRLLWELDVGFLADVTKEPLAYSDQRTSNSTLGYGEIDKHGPRFIPLDFRK